MAITPQDNSAFMREVDEQVRKDQATQFWERWGLWLAGLVIAALAAFGGWLWWSNSQQTAAEGEAEELSQIFVDLEEGRTADLDERLIPLTESPRGAVRAAALMERGNIALQNDDTEAAAGFYASVAVDEDLPQQYRDLALIRQTAAEFDTMEPQAVIDRLAPLTNAESHWFGSAGELTAAAMLRMGNEEEAGALLAEIGNSETVPDSLRTRAVQLAGVLGVDAVSDEPVEMDENQPPAQPGGPEQSEAGQ